MTTVFLTGASGFLGGHVLTALRAAGHEVKALSRRTETDAVITALGATPVRASLDNSESLQRAMEGCEAVFHVAADTSMWRRNAAQQTATNVQGTQNMLRAAERSGVKAFIHTSSVSAFSHLVHGTLDESVAQLGEKSWINYERTKCLGEQAVRVSNVPWIVFNPSHILGPGDRHNWSRLITMIDREKLPGIPPGLASFADVREIARAQVRAWQDQRFGQSYLVGGERITFVDFAHKVGTALGKRTPKGATPAWALMAFARAVDLWSRVTGKEPDMTPEGAMLTCHQLQVNSSKAEHELGYVQTPVDAVLADTLAWMRTERMVGA